MTIGKVFRALTYERELLPSLLDRERVPSAGDPPTRLGIETSQFSDADDA